MSSIDNPGHTQNTFGVNIAVDCRHIDSSGVGVYLRGCLGCMLESGHSLLLLGERRRLEALAGGRATIVDCAVKPFSLRELLAFPARNAVNGADVYWSPYFNVPGGITIPVCTTIHDVIFYDMPGLVPPPGLLARKFFFKRAARRSQTVFTVSEFSKSRILRHLGGNLNVVVTWSGVQEHIAAWQGPSPKTKTLVYVGNIKKHKGLALLVQAFSAAMRETGLDYTLVIAGVGGNFRSKEDAALLGGPNIRLAGGIGDAELVRLVAEAALLVQPSLYEGFGLPPLEAMMLGTTALVSDIPVFREVYGDFPVVFFKSGDAADLKDKIIAFLYHTAQRRVELDGGLKARFSFAKTAGIVLEELCRIAKRNR